MKYVLKSVSYDKRNVILEASDDEELQDCVRDALSDEVDNLFTINDPPARGDFRDIGLISTELRESVRSRLGDVVGNYTLSCRDNGSVIGLCSILNKIIESRESDIDVGFYVLSMLRKFLIRGCWHYGLMNRDGVVLEDKSKWPKPKIDPDGVRWIVNEEELNAVIWFGLDGETPIEYWSIDKRDKRFARMPYCEGCDVEFWKSCWFNHFWTFDWNVLTDNNEGLIIWMFAECGMDEPVVEFEQVKTACPITLDENDSRTILSRKIDDFFLEESRKATKRIEECDEH